MAAPHRELGSGSVGQPPGGGAASPTSAAPRPAPAVGSAAGAAPAAAPRPPSAPRQPAPLLEGRQAGRSRRTAPLFCARPRRFQSLPRRAEGGEDGVGDQRQRDMPV